jgi:hypothetical protein
VFGALGLFGEKELLCVQREAGADPVEKRGVEGFGESSNAVKGIEHQVAEELGEGVGVEGRKGQELPLGVEGAPGDQGMDVGVEVRGVGAEGLERGDAGGEDVLALEHGAEALLDRGVGAAREQAEESALAFEESAERLGDREHVVSVGNGGEDLLAQLLGKERGALGLA